MPSPGDDRDIWHAERQAGIGGARDRFGLSALLRADARVGAGGIHNRQHRNAKPIRHLHQPTALR